MDGASTTSMPDGDPLQVGAAAEKVAHQGSQLLVRVVHQVRHRVGAVHEVEQVDGFRSVGDDTGRE